MPRSTDARAKALDTAERLFRTQGYAATGLTQIIAESGSPKGSFYFHFPEGKEQLAREVIERYAARARTAIEQVSAATEGDALAFVATICSAFAAEMRRSEYQLGCAVQNIANEQAFADTPLTDMLRAALNGWLAAIEEHFAKCGIPASRARKLARALVSGLEGARTVARIQRKDDAFRDLAMVMSEAINS